MSIKGLEQAIANLNSISKTAVPRASAQSVNRIAVQAVNQSSTRVAKELKVPRRLIKQRVKIRRATVRTPKAEFRVNRGDLPAIKLASDITKIPWHRKGNKKKGYHTITKVGPLRLERAFVQKLKNRRWHVMQREGASRYPIDVVKIPTTTPLTQAYREELPRLINEKLPKIMAQNLKNQFRVTLKR